MGKSRFLRYFLALSVQQCRNVPTKNENVKRDKKMSTNTELSTGKSLLVIAVVLGCFAVLWPKIFYPMLFGSNSGSSSNRQFEGGKMNKL